MTRTNRMLALALAAAAGPLAGIASAQMPARRIAGCYVLSWRNATTGDTIGPDAFPDTIALLLDSVPGEYDGRAVRISEAHQQLRAAYRYTWRVLPGDKLTIAAVSGPETATVLVVGVDTSGFEGPVHVFLSERDPPHLPYLSVRGHRRGCWGLSAVPPN